MTEFIEELKHNQKINYKKGIENRIDIDYVIERLENIQKTEEIQKMYNNIENLRKQVKNNKKAMKYYNYLKELNKSDQLYGWMFDNDAILTDTMDELDLYNENYLHDILVCYYGELETILSDAK